MMSPSELPKRHNTWKSFVWFALFILFLILSSIASEVDLSRFFENFDQMGVILGKMMHPDKSYIKIVIPPLLETIKMAIIGTTLGAIFAFPFSLAISRNLVKNKFVNTILRFILNIIRTIPDLMLAAVFVAIVGIGPVAGIISLAIFSFGMIAKLFYETIETIDEGPIEAIISSGGSKIDVIRYAVIPQIMSHFFSYLLYAFEINVRASTVLGYIGAGGIGIFLQRSLSQFRYDQTSIIVIAIFAVVLIIDAVSNQLRERLL